MSTGRVMVPLVLGKTMVEAEVFIVNNEIPFLLGGEILRQHKTEISVSENKLTVNNHTMRLKLLNSGHMAIPWSPKTHKMEDHASNVFLTQRVKPKERGNPEVQEAMHKQWGVLQEHGTYEEVSREPWMTVIPTMWVINRTTDDGGKDAGKLKARLVVRGDQDKNKTEVPCDSPTVDRTTVKLMIALGAILGWNL